MDIIYQWVFSNFVSVTDKDFPGNIITSLNYQLSARSGSAFASTTGVVSLPYPELSDFVNFGDVNNAHLQQWVEEALGKGFVAAIKAGLAKQIERQLNSPNKQLPKSFQSA